MHPDKETLERKEAMEAKADPECEEERVDFSDILMTAARLASLFAGYLYQEADREAQGEALHATDREIARLRRRRERLLHSRPDLL